LTTKEKKWVNAFETLRGREWFMKSGKYYERPFLTSDVRSVPYRIGFPLDDSDIFVIQLNYFMIDFERENLVQLKEIADTVKGTLILHGESSFTCSKKVKNSLLNEGWTQLKDGQDVYYLYGTKTQSCLTLFYQLQAIRKEINALPFEIATHVELNLFERIWHKCRKHHPHVSICIKRVKNNPSEWIEFTCQYHDNTWGFFASYKDSPCYIPLDVELVSQYIKYYALKFQDIEHYLLRPYNH